MISAVSVVLAIAGGSTLELPAAVLVEGETLACTGALVAPEVVLTAAHCLESRMWVDGAEVDGLRPHPSWDADAPGLWDLALLYLADPRDEAPLTLGPTPALTDPVRHVGLGLAEGDEAHVLRAADAEVVNLFDQVLATLELDGSPCSGDSGGPVLDAEGRLVGVTSFTPDCADDVNGAARVDVAWDWLQTSIDAGPPDPEPDPDPEPPPTGCSGCALVVPFWIRWRRGR